VSLTNHSQLMVENFVRKHSIPWANGYEATAGTILRLGAGSGMPGPAEYEVAPTLYLVGPDGRVRWVDGRGRYHHAKPDEWEATVDVAIAKFLDESPRSTP